MDVDVTITLGTVLPVPTLVTPAGTRFCIDDRSARLFYPDAAFQIRGGREIVIEPRSNADERVIRLLLQGPVFAVLLHQRGLLVLHASAVAIGNGASLFLGVSGAGKSSIAAALHARGHDILSDDIVAVDLKHEPIVHSGWPLIKLWPDSAAALAVDPQAGLSLRTGISKRGWRCPSRLEQSLPVERIHVLETDASCVAVRMPPVDAFTELVGHSYLAPLFPEGLGARHFLQCSTLAASGLVWRLGYARALGELSKVAAFVARRGNDRACRVH